MLCGVPAWYFAVDHPKAVGGERLLAVAELAAEAVWLTAAALAVAWLLRRLRSPWPFRVWMGIAAGIAALNYLVDVTMMGVYQSVFNHDIAAVVLATNPDEAGDFLSTYLATGNFWLTLLISGSAIAAISFGINWIAGKIGRKWRLIAGGAVVAASIPLAAMPTLRQPKFVHLRAKINTFTHVDLGHRPVMGTIEPFEASETAPEKLVVIIGESLGSSHCQLYGYPLATQPHLTALADTARLTVVAGSKAPETHTIEAFRRFIGTWDGNESTPWWTCPTWIELARAAGYKTTWISNQSRKGVYDNPVVKISDNVHRRAFTNTGFRGMSSGGHDERVLPLIDKLVKPGEKELVVVHLMGSHVAYHGRYPKAFRRFREADYPDAPKGQRATLAAYDNSVVYNDSIVSEIISRVADRDAVVIYFSDHAQDLFDTAPNYFGHARPGNEESKEAALRVPLIVYQSACNNSHIGRVPAATDSLYYLIERILR